MNVLPNNKLISALGPNFEKAGLKFRKTDSEFRRTLPCGNMVAVGVDLLRASRPGYFKAAVSAHIRIQIIEDVYIPHHPYVQPRDRKGHYTLSVNCDNIFRDRSVSQSFELLSDEAVVGLSENLWRAISDDVLPFLEKYCDRERLVENLRSDDYSSRVTSDPMTRYCVLISDRALAGDEGGFENYATEFLDHCKKPYGQMYLPAANAIISGIRAQIFRRSRK